MFQPNGIRALRQLSQQNQLERGDLDEIASKQSSRPITASTHASQSEQYLQTDQLIQSIKQAQRNPVQVCIMQKQLLKEINQQIDEIKEWRENQKSQFNQNIKKNKIEAAKQQTSIVSCLDYLDDEEAQDQEYEKKTLDLKNRLAVVRKQLKLDVKDKQYTQSQMSSDFKTDQINKKLADSQSKLDKIQVEKIMGMIEYQNSINNSDIQNQIESEVQNSVLLLQLELAMKEFDEYIQSSDLSIYKNKEDAKKEYQLDINSLKQQSDQLSEKYKDLNDTKEKINKDLKEIDQDFEEIDKLMSQCGIK